MTFITGLRCTVCGTQYPPDTPYTCTKCGIGGILDVEYDYDQVRSEMTKQALSERPLNQWRYQELLPVDVSKAPNLSVGWTPIYETKALAQHIGIRTLCLKDDGRNPTGSLKDRPSAVAVTRAVTQKQDVVSCASTGNAASSLAGMAAAAGIRSVIFLPERAPEPKVAQLLVFGATVLRVMGSYDEAWELCQKSCERYGWYNRNAAVNAYLVEGKKTVGLEICEQMKWRPPDWVAMSVGDGCTIAAAWKAFREMKQLGLIARTPKMLGVQAEGAAPVTAAFRSGADLKPIEPKTVADSISVGVPRNWRKAVNAIRESGGQMINVSDDEILDAIKYTGRLSGVFAEPAASASIAGVKRAVAEHVIEAECNALAVVTGSGLKDVRAAQQAAGKPFEVGPDGTGLEEALRKRSLVS
jgi:threonine synthase